MDVVILCGGKGMRMSNITNEIPKPLAEIAGKPIIWHIMKHYSKYGHNKFILPLGYKGDMLKDYFYNYRRNNNNYVQHIKDNSIKYLDNELENWEITFINTGEETMTGARVKKVEKYISSDNFLLTYGDGISDVDIESLVQYHYDMGKLVTVTGIDYKSSYGIIETHNGIATEFKEKPILDHIINGGFLVCNKKALKYLTENEACIMERTLLQQAAAEGELAVYKHDGYWIGIDTCKDIQVANELINEHKN